MFVCLVFECFVSSFRVSDLLSKNVVPFTFLADHSLVYFLFLFLFGLICVSFVLPLGNTQEYFSLTL